MIDVAIIIGTTREGRFGERAAAFVADVAATRDDLRAEILDLRDYDLPTFDEPVSPAWGPSRSEAARRWQRDVARFDGYVFVTAEYNRSIPASLKNALDYSYGEWNRKPAGYVGYGTVGGARAVEHLRLINVEQQMAPVRAGVHLAGADFFGLSKGTHAFDDLPYVRQGVTAMLDEVSWWGHALKRARDAEASEVERAAA